VWLDAAAVAFDRGDLASAKSALLQSRDKCVPGSPDFADATLALLDVAALGGDWEGVRFGLASPAVAGAAAGGG